MRISTGYQFDSYSRGVSDAQRTLLETQMRAQSGKRVSKPSDDPNGAASVVRMNALKVTLGQYRENGQTAKGTLATLDGALGDVADLSTQAYQTAVRAANSSATPEGRRAMAEEIGQLQKRLIELGNTQDPTGAYVFGGQKSDTAPFSTSGNVLNYSGSPIPSSVEVNADLSVVTSVPGQPLLTDLYTKLQTLREALVDGSETAISEVGVKPLQDSTQAVNLARAAVGTRINTIDEVQQQHLRREDELTGLVSDVEDVDFAQAIMDYRLAESAYEAALNVASQGFRLSLMDFIRG